MDAGKTKIPVGTRIEITHIIDFEDAELVGKTGTICQPFGFSVGNELCGMELDDKTMRTGDIINLLDGDKFKVIGSGILITKQGHRFSPKFLKWLDDNGIEAVYLASVLDDEVYSIIVKED